MDPCYSLFYVDALELIHSLFRQNLPDFEVVLIAKTHESFCLSEVFYKPYSFSMDSETTENLCQLRDMENLYCTFFETKNYEFLIQTCSID